MSKNADIIMQQCLKQGMPLRLSERDGKFICIVEKVWVTVEADTLDEAVINACTKALINES
jgi:hypothetical protein